MKYSNLTFILILIFMTSSCQESVTSEKNELSEDLSVNQNSKKYAKNTIKDNIWATIVTLDYNVSCNNYGVYVLGAEPVGYDRYFQVGLVAGSGWSTYFIPLSELEIPAGEHKSVTVPIFDDLMPEISGTVKIFKVISANGENITNNYNLLETAGTIGCGDGPFEPSGEYLVKWHSIVGNWVVCNEAAWEMFPDLCAM